MSFKLICSICGEDINEKNQDNMSHGLKPICEDCNFIPEEIVLIKQDILNCSTFDK